jgi:hypothetical protein
MVAMCTCGFKDFDTGWKAWNRKKAKVRASIQARIRGETSQVMIASDSRAGGDSRSGRLARLKPHEGGLGVAGSEVSALRQREHFSLRCFHRLPCEL